MRIRVRIPYITLNGSRLESVVGISGLITTIEIVLRGPLRIFSIIISRTKEEAYTNLNGACLEAVVGVSGLVSTIEIVFGGLLKILSSAP